MTPGSNRINVSSMSLVATVITPSATAKLYLSVCKPLAELSSIKKTQHVKVEMIIGPFELVIRSKSFVWVGSEIGNSDSIGGYKEPQVSQTVEAVR